MSQPKFLLERFGFIAISLLAIAAYLSGLFGGFEFDDFWNIVENPSLRNLDGSFHSWLTTALSSNSGTLRRPLSMLSFALNSYAFGLEPLAFKCVNLGIHICNGLLIWQLTRRLIPHVTATSSPRASESIALLVAAIWMLSPIHVSGVVYIVQRMNELASLFTLAGLWCYVEGRSQLARDEAGNLIIWGGTLLFALLAVLCKENGALLFAYAFVIELSVFRFNELGNAARRSLGAYFIAFLALPLIGLAGYLLVHPEWLTAGYQVRDFTLQQRLLSEPRILWHYVTWILLPWPPSMGLYHDDFVTSAALFSPWTTAVSIFAWLLTAAIAWKKRLSWPAFSFAIFWFLAGHSMESSIFSLELIFEHRNYLPSFGLLLGAVCLAQAAVVRRLPEKLHSAPAVLVFVVIMALTAGTAWRAYQWGDPARLAMTAVKNHPDSPRAHYDAGRELILQYAARGESGGAAAARPYFEAAMRLDRNYVAPSAGFISSFSGKGPVPNEAIEDFTRRLREERLLQPNALLALLNNAADRQVQLSPAQIEKIVDGAMSNKSATPPIRAMILNNYGRYQFQVEQDAQSAVSLTLAAAELDPRNPFFQVNLAKLALQVGQPEIAAQRCDQAEQLDVSGQYRASIAGIRTQLPASHLNETPADPRTLPAS